MKRVLITKTLFAQRLSIYATALICMGMFYFIQPVIADSVVIDHDATDITQIPQAAIEQAKSTLHIAYGHTSHGSQLTTGMTGLIDFANNGGLGLDLPDGIFAWNNGGVDGALDLHDYAMGGDVGYYPQWVDNTRAYLDDPSHADTNVIVWSWCGQLSSYTEQEVINQYLNPMAQLEAEYPDVTFVYMTGHADGSGETGNLHLRNQQIRNYCIQNEKVLYDFYDIEIYDPDGNYFGDKRVDDACNYDSDGDGARDANWAVEWQNSHTEGQFWYDCYAAHSQPLNANRKAYAAWWLWATLAGWDSSSGDGIDLCPDDPEKTAPGICGCGVADTDSDSDGTLDCEDLCPLDPEKTQPGYCGCGYPEDSCDHSADGDTAIFSLEEGESIICSIFANGGISLSEVAINDVTIETLYPAIHTDLSDIGLGSTIRLDMTYPEIQNNYSIYLYLDEAWQDISENVHATMDFDTSQVTLYLTDGGYGDLDRIENGEISSAVAIAKPLNVDTDIESPSQPAISDSGGGGCFLGLVRWIDLF